MRLQEKTTEVIEDGFNKTPPHFLSAIATVLLLAVCVLLFLVGRMYDRDISANFAARDTILQLHDDRLNKHSQRLDELSEYHQCNEFRARAGKESDC